MNIWPETRHNPHRPRVQLKPVRTVPKVAAEEKTRFHSHPFPGKKKRKPRIFLNLTAVVHPRFIYLIKTVHLKLQHQPSDFLEAHPTIRIYKIEFQKVERGREGEREREDWKSLTQLHTSLSLSPILSQSLPLFLSCFVVSTFLKDRWLGFINSS